MGTKVQGNKCSRNSHHKEKGAFRKSPIAPWRFTNSELGQCLEEYNLWRRGKGEYAKIGSEAPFTAERLGQIIDEAVYRLKIIGAISLGRFGKPSI